MAIQLSDSIFVGQQKPVEDKYYNGLSPYANTAEVNSTLASAIRYRGLTVNVNGVEYWYKNGILDTDLIAKATGGGGGGAIEIQDEGTTIDSAATIINFTGAGVAASGPGTGTVTVNIPGGGGGGSSTYTPVDLTSANYTITSAGQYEVKNGSLSNVVILPNPTSVNNGDSITIVNHDTTTYYKAILDQTHQIHFQGGVDVIASQGGSPLTVYGRIKDIPFGMTYRFEAVQNTSQAYWMCHPINVEPYYDGIILQDGTGNDYPLYIKNYGTYNIVRGSEIGKGSTDSYVYFPDPQNHIGKKVTISIIPGIYVEIKNNGFEPYVGNYFNNTGGTSDNNPRSLIFLQGGGVYTFMAVTSAEYATPFWSCISAIPAINPITTVSLSASSYTITGGGIYIIVNNGSNLLFQTKGQGQRFTIINTTSSGISIGASGYQDIINAGGTIYTSIPAYTTIDVITDHTSQLRLLYQY